MTTRPLSGKSRAAYACIVLLCGATAVGCGMDSDNPAEGPPPAPSPGAPAPTEGGGRPPAPETGAGGAVVPPPAPSPAPSPPTPPEPAPPGMAPPAPTAPPTGIDPGTPPAPPAVAPPLTGAAPYGCTGCTRLFNGVDLEGWETAPGAWVVQNGVLASTGKVPGELYTKEDLGSYRIFFQVRHVKAMGGKDHQSCTTLFGKRPADPASARSGISGAQFQPPSGYSWDYGAGGSFKGASPRPKFDNKQWHQCEVLVKEAGSFRAACCTMGETACKTVEVLSWTGTGRKHPFNIQMHNGGLFDEYKELWIERDPTVDDLLSNK